MKCGETCGVEKKVYVGRCSAATTSNVVHEEVQVPSIAF